MLTYKIKVQLSRVHDTDFRPRIQKLHRKEETCCEIKTSQGISDSKILKSNTFRRQLPRYQVGRRSEKGLERYCRYVGLLGQEDAILRLPAAVASRDGEELLGSAEANLIHEQVPG